MVDYPDSVYAPRTKENIAGVTYDPAKTTIGFAEDLNYLEDEILAMIADLIGTGQAGGLKTPAYPSLSARLAIDINQSTPQTVNLKLARNAAVNTLDIFAKSTGAVPAAASPIKTMIPDDTGHTLRSRSAQYLSGTSQITLADAVGYWGKASNNGSKYTAYLYAIWDGTGIIWALCAHSGITKVPTTTTASDENYFLLETSSTYTKNAAHFCISVAKIEYEYDTSDTPDHTISSNNFQIIHGRDPSDTFRKEKSYSTANINLGLTEDENFVDADATNAAITFTPPRSGRYKATFFLDWHFTNNGTGTGRMIERFRLTDGTNYSPGIAAGGELPSTMYLQTAMVAAGSFFLTAGTPATIKLQKQNTAPIRAASNHIYALTGQPLSIYVEEICETQ